MPFCGVFYCNVQFHNTCVSNTPSLPIKVGGLGVYISYGVSTLYNTLTQSERGINTFELKDKLGRVTHKFQQLDNGYAVTAYCYDDALGGRLAYVLAVAGLPF